MRLRRDLPTLFGLIRAHALLHQLNRARDAQGRILASLDDYAVVRELVADLMADAVAATVSATVRATVQAAAKLIQEATKVGRTEAREATVSIAQMTKALDLDKSAASRRVSVCIQNGYLVNLEDKRGKPSRLQLGSALPDDVTLLPHAARVAEADRCSVAVEAEGIPAMRAFSEPVEPIASSHGTGSDPRVHLEQIDDQNHPDWRLVGLNCRSPGLFATAAQAREWAAAHGIAVEDHP